MPMFRKKPVVIEAREYVNEAEHPLMVEALIAWCGGEKTKEGIVIHTLEGDHLASPGDMIIKGVRGEFYPCKIDIFKQTYDQMR